jgi:hypothetical protein
MANHFIHYETKQGNEYASIYCPKWENGQKKNDRENLGRVIDKENGIFKSRLRGLFKYDLVNGFHDIDDKKEKAISNDRCLVFGNVYYLNEVLKKSSYYNLFIKTYPYSPDTLLSLIFLGC